MTLISSPDRAATAYDRLAPFYDRFTSGYAHRAWVRAIDRHARRLGLHGRSALDVGCGTGKSTAALLDLGYEVIGCDISPEMIAVAERGPAGARADFLVADMRALPDLGAFDLILCLDDAVNYLTSDDDLRRALRSLAGALAPGGILTFDTNSLATYRSAFAQPMVREQDGVFFTWLGRGAGDHAPGAPATATVEVFAERADGLWERRTSEHHQRHHPMDAVLVALEDADLECCSVLGQLPGARLEEVPDETRHIKLVYFARRADAPDHERRDGMRIISPRIISPR